MKVVGIKLINGDEIVARVATPSADGMVIEMARTIGLQETQQGVGLGFMPWTLSNPDAEVKLSAKDYFAVFDVKPEIEKAYLSQTSKIQLMG